MEHWTLEQIGGWLALILGIGAGVRYLLTPVINYNQKQKEIETKFEETEKKLDNDNKRLTLLEHDTKEILLSVNALLQHSIDNNHDDELKKRKSELDKYLIER